MAARVPPLVLSHACEHYLWEARTSGNSNNTCDEVQYLGLLVLQLQLCKPTELTLAIMASFGAGLVASPPDGPGEKKLNGLKHFPHQAI